MPNSRACYRKLRRYKYQLMQDYTISIDIETEEDIEMSFIVLTSDGKLTIKNRYAWDGPSGPTIDTKSFMRGSLVHDALYQLMRERKLDYLEHREYADNLLKKICLEDGMSKFVPGMFTKQFASLARKMHGHPQSPKTKSFTFLNHL